MRTSPKEPARDPMNPSNEAVEAARRAVARRGVTLTVDDATASLTAAYAIDLAPVLERAKWAEDRVQFLVSLDAKFGPKSRLAQRPSQEDVARAVEGLRAIRRNPEHHVRLAVEEALAVLISWPTSAEPAPPSEPAALASSAEHGWRPISEAPDRTDVLVARRDKLGNPLPPIVAGLYDNGDTTGWSSFDSQDTWIEGRATYWQPLPAPPAPASEEGR